MRKTPAIDTINIFFGVLMASCLFLAGWAPEGRLAGLLTYLGQPQGWGISVLRGLFMLIGVLVFVGNILAAWRDYCTGNRPALTITSESGSTRFSIAGIEAQLLEAICQETDVIEPNLHLQVRDEGLPIICRLICKLKQQDDVTGRAERLKKLLGETFLRLIPTGTPIDITIDVLDIVSKEVATAATTTATTSGEEFTGPVYPTDNNDETDADTL